MPDLFGNEEIRALSWKEPFASLMLRGKIETRTWSTKYRGKVLICASQKSYTEMEIIGIAGEVQIQRILLEGCKEQNGYAIAVGELVGCRKMTPEDEDKCFVAYRDGLYCHVYANVRPIVPFPWKGSQGWKRLSEEDKGRIDHA